MDEDEMNERIIIDSESSNSRVVPYYNLFNLEGTLNKATISTTNPGFEFSK